MRVFRDRWRKVRGQAVSEAGLVTILMIIATVTLGVELFAPMVEKVMASGHEAIQSSKPFEGSGS